MSEQMHVYSFENGLTLLGQPMTHVDSTAVSLMVRCGASFDPEGHEGAAAVGGEWIMRGAGERNTRELHDELDRLGCEHHISPLSEHLRITASQIGRNLPEVLDLLGDIVMHPRLEDASFEPCRNLIAQDLDAMEDDPAGKCNYILRERFFPYPLGRGKYGSRESLSSISAQGVREHLRAYLQPGGAILAVAGKFDWDELLEQTSARFGAWKGKPISPPAVRPPINGALHIEKDTAQTHLALAQKSATVNSPHYYPARIAEAVLSRGMGSRLFTEVREKRALVYHVGASHVSLLDHAGMFTYAGTRPDVAEQTFEVTTAELRRLREGISEEEMDRAKVQLRSILVMQGESTASRARALAGDWHHLSRLRSLEEISQAIRDVQEQNVMDYLDAYPAENFTILSIGPKPIAGVTETS